jgi:hypothetical protein
MAYNMTFPPPQNATDFTAFLKYMNSLTDVGSGGNLGILFLVLISGVLFMMTKAFGTERALGISFFITGIFAGLFRLLDLVNNYVVSVCTILAAMGVWLYFKEAAPYEQ